MYGALTIGTILRVLDELPAKHVTSYGWDDAYSYRGYYEELSVNRTKASVATMRAVLQGAVGRVMDGYKGGEYLMKLDTGVWVASWGAPGHPITVDTLELFKHS